MLGSMLRCDFSGRSSIIQNECGFAKNQREVGIIRGAPKPTLLLLIKVPLLDLLFSVNLID
jgi:hypothetical protein